MLSIFSLVLYRVGQDIRPFSMYGQIPDIETNRPDIQQYKRLQQNSPLTNRHEHNFINFRYYIRFKV